MTTADPVVATKSVLSENVNQRRRVGGAVRFIIPSLWVRSLLLDARSRLVAGCRSMPEVEGDDAFRKKFLRRVKFYSFGWSQLPIAGLLPFRPGTWNIPKSDGIVAKKQDLNATMLAK